MNRARSVRFRLLLIAILPMFVILPAIVGGLIYQWDLRFDRLLASKVGGDLKVAGQYMNQLLVNDRATLAAIADSQSFHGVISQGVTRMQSLAAY